MISTRYSQHAISALLAFVIALFFAVTAQAQEEKTLKGVALVIGQSKCAPISRRSANPGQ